MFEGLKKYFNSRKAISAILGSLFLGVMHTFGVPVDQALGLAAPLLAHIGGQSVVDAVEAIRKK